MKNNIKLFRTFVIIGGILSLSFLPNVTNLKKVNPLEKLSKILEFPFFKKNNNSSRVANSPVRLNADYDMATNNGQTINVCSGNFYDSGGIGGDYANSENNSITFCSDNGNSPIIDFTAFDVEFDASCTYDGLSIYDGSSTSATLLGTYCGTNSPGTVTASGTCLHLVFYSDGSVVNPGWEATISCTGTPPVIPLYVTLDNVNTATCANSDGDIAITTTGGTTPYTFAWSNGASTEDLTNVVAGNYTVTISDAVGNQIIENYTIYNTSPVSSGYSVINAACPSADGAINLTPLNGTAPYTFVWSNGATSEDLSSLSDDIYEVTVTDANGCEGVTSILVGCGAENCNNGIDDDGDGFIDYYDSDCPCDNSGFFFGNCVPSCQYTPPPGSGGFDLTTEWIGATGVTNISQLFVGDMDGEPDEMPEIVAMKAMSYHASDINAIYILNGADGTLKYHPNTLRYHNRNKGLAVGDVDNDGLAEFFYVTAADETTGNATKIACYEYNPAGVNPSGTGTGTFDLQWVSNQTVTCGLSVTDQPYTEDFTVSLADFNYDGVPEIYVGNDVFNAQTGTKIATGGANSIGSWNAGEFTTAYHVMAVSVAVDVLPDAACADCSGLELVAGNQVYSVNVGTGTMTVQKTAANSLPDGNTAIVDYDLDGDLDAVITSNDASSSFLYIWDLQTTAQIGNTHTVATTSSLFYHPINTPIIADFDGDNRPEIGVCGSLVFQVVEDHLTNIGGTGGTLWSITTSDNSGQTGASVFDFNGDGVAEVVYRDESNLRVISGPTGTNLATFPCGSGTGGEYAVIADIDNDDETEIVCNCSNSPGASSATAYTTAFKSDNFPWVDTRKVWNQYAYFNVNINDDLTIPQQQQTHHTVGNPALGTTGALNTFLKQVSPLDKSGNRVFPAPDLVTSTSVDGALCLSNSTVALSIEISNNGQSTAPSDMPIAIYETDPESTNATLLTTIMTNSSVPSGSSITASYTLDVSTFSFPKTIYVVVNDDNSEAMPYDLSTDFPVTNIAECDFTNNKESVSIASGCIAVEICGNGTDDDGDGLTDCEDPDCYLVSNTGGTDTDGDGIDDKCDIDDDNDGILDIVECPAPTNSGLTGPLTTFTTSIATTDATSSSVPHILNSITLNGITYSDFITPDAYTPGYTVIDLNEVNFVENGVDYVYSLGSNANYNQDIITDAFGNKNLNAHQSLDSEDFSDGDYYILTYNNPIISTSGGFIAVTERLGNNEYYIDALDNSNNLLGSIIVNTSDYVDLGVNVYAYGTQNANMALYPVDDLAPIGSEISSLKISFGTSVTATNDGPDGKVFIIGDVTTIACDFDGDGIPNHLDPDSDNDGCPDAIEGGGSFTVANIINNRLTGGVGGNGVPSVAGGGQAVGSSQNENVIVCCDANASGYTDTDSDGISDDCDEDDDNDGILDIVECPVPTNSGLTGPLTTFTGHVTTTNASSNAVPHILDSITYNGTTYTDFIVPDSYTPGFSLSDQTGVSFVKEGSFLFNIGSNSSYNTAILPAFQSRNLNAYQDLDRNDFSNGDYFDLKYNTPVLSTAGGFIAVTERGGNNPQVIQALDISGNIIGTTVNVSTSDYVDLGVRVDPSGGQNANLALYPIDDLAPVGTEIHGIRISFGTSSGAASDGPDAKAFLFGDVAQLSCDYDGDGIPNHLDLDSDNDGCSDALEGAANITSANIVANRISGSIDVNGVPVLASSGQGLGVSQNENITLGCNEICDDNIDNDGDGLIDCADSDCKPIISNVTSTAPTCASTTGGQIVITATGSGTLSYSITNEASWQSSNTFSNLGVGQYTIRVKNNFGCETTYASNPIVFDISACPEICDNNIDDDGDGLIDCEDPDCDGVGVANPINNN